MIPRGVSRGPRYGVHRVGVDQDTERAAVDDEPGNEGAELRRREDVHLEHGDRVWADGLLPEPVDAQLGDYRGTSATRRDPLRVVGLHSLLILSHSSLANFFWSAFF